MRFLIAILATVCILALSATIGALVIGIKSFEGLVVEKPYETGLKWDEMQQQKENLASAAGTASDCDIQRGPCRRETTDGLSVSFDISPRPVAAMSDSAFAVTLSRRGTPAVDAASVTLDLSMPGMVMGKNRPAMKSAGPGRYEGKGTIVRCMSGRKTWKASVTVKRPARTDAVDFMFEVN